MPLLRGYPVVAVDRDPDVPARIPSRGQVEKLVLVNAPRHRHVGAIPEKRDGQKPDQEHACARGDEGRQHRASRILPHERREPLPDALDDGGPRLQPMPGAQNQQGDDQGADPRGHRYASPRHPFAEAAGDVHRQRQQQQPDGEVIERATKRRHDGRSTRHEPPLFSP